MKKLMILLFVCALGHSATLTVDLNGGGDYTDIQSAIDAAVDGDTVLVKPGEYVITAPITFNGKAITVESEAGAAQTIVRMSETPDDLERASVVIFETDETESSMLDGFNLTGGQGTQWGDKSWEYGGGGILCTNATFPSIIDCTITGNSGGGIHCYCSSPTLTNCIVWNNAGESIYKPGSSNPQVSFSCIECDWPWTGEGNINEEPLFAVNSDYRLQESSPCIDAGTLAEVPETDIDGNARPCGGGVDMGAYEWGDCGGLLQIFLRGEVNADGKINLADAIFMLTYLFADGTAPPCLDAADANDSGKLDLADGIVILDYIFGDTDALPAPFGECGSDPTADGLDCGDYTACQ